MSEQGVFTMSGQEPMPFIITIDGPAGVGKSTLAKGTAKAMSLSYLDTGAMFRAVALELAEELRCLHHAAHGLTASSSSMEDIRHTDAYMRLVRRLDEQFPDDAFALRGKGDASRLTFKGNEPGPEIRSEQVGMLAAQAGTIPEIREYLKKAQQRIGTHTSLVVEGRDMGTVVFPNARCKFFLKAELQVRAERRFLQLQAMGKEADLDSIRMQMEQRDEQDTVRHIAPLCPAADARIIDTSYLDIEEVLLLILRRIRQHRDAFPVVPLRRKDRALSLDETLDLLQRGEYGILSVTTNDGHPYGVPLSYVLFNDSLYFHAAQAGRKLSALRLDNRFCFTVVMDVQAVYAGDFSTYYTSAMVFGHAHAVTDDDEKYAALLALVQKYLPQYMDKADGDIRRSFSRTAVYRLCPEHTSGKAKRRKTE